MSILNIKHKHKNETFEYTSLIMNEMPIIIKEADKWVVNMNKGYCN